MKMRTANLIFTWTVRNSLRCCLNTVLVRQLRLKLNWHGPVFKGGPKPSCLLFFRGDFKSNFRLSGIFVPVGQFFPARSSNRAAEVGVGVKWLGPRRLGKMAARSDAARQRPRGHPGLQHTSVRPPSDATPPRYCRFSHFTTYRGPRAAGIGWQST